MHYLSKGAMRAIITVIIYHLKWYADQYYTFEKSCMVVINSVYFKEEDMMSNNLLFFLLSQHYCPQTHFEKKTTTFSS